MQGEASMEEGIYEHNWVKSNHANGGYTRDNDAEKLCT